MDEEEELENTLIGQEEEAPAIDTVDELMGAGQQMFTADPNVVASVPGIENISNPGAFNPANVEPVEPAGGELGYFQRLGEFAKSALNRDQGLFDVDRLGTAADDLLGSAMRNLTPVEELGYTPEPFGKTVTDIFAITRPDGTKFYPDEVTSPAEIQSPTATAQSFFGRAPASNAAEAAQRLIDAGPAFTQGQAPALDPTSDEAILARRAEREAQFAPQRPMGQDATRARLGGMTLNEYLNAPAGTPGVSGLRTDPQGRMITPSAQPPVDSAVPTAVAQPPVDALSSFERDSLARQQRIGGTGSFAGDSAAREARLAERDRLPGETQTERDTRIAQSRTTGGQTEGLSFDDARRRAEGQLAARGVRNPSASQVNALARSIQAAEPERLAELETQRAKDAADLKKSELAASFEPKELEIGGKKYIQYTPTYIQPVIEDTPEKTGLQSTLENLQSDLTSGRLTQEEYDIAVRTATNSYIGREKPKGQTSSSEFQNIMAGAAAGGTPTGDATDAPQVATGRGQARRGRPIGTDDSTSQAPVRVNSQAEYDALAVGTPYIDSQGTETVKK
jgi:hypothetical protein